MNDRLSMRLRTVVLSVIVGTFFVASVRTQDRPTFAGRWTPAGPGSQPAQPLLVGQTETSLTVENWSRSGPSSGIHRWGSDPQLATLPTASWHGAELVVTFPRSHDAARAVRT